MGSARKKKKRKPPRSLLGDYISPCTAPIGGKGVQCVAFDAVYEKGNSGTNDFIATAYGEGLMRA